MSTDSFLSPLTAGDGENIAIHDWPLPDGRHEPRIRGTVIIVHGLGEHAFRYAQAAQFFNTQGFRVRAYDQYGHGESGGVRGTIPTEMRLVDDLADVVDDTQRNMQTGDKLILLGHSMGGVVVASFVRQQVRPIDGIILSSPALDPGLNPVQKLLLSTLPRLAPNLCVDNGLKVEKLCRDPKVVQAYKKDPLVHRHVSGRLAKFIADEGSRIIEAAPSWTTPSLLIYAGSDDLVSPDGSLAFANNAPTAVVQTHCFQPMYHEILNDLDKEQVYARLQEWLLDQ